MGYYLNISEFPYNYTDKVIHISELDIIRDYCQKYAAFPAYSFFVMFGLSLAFFGLYLLKRSNPYFTAFLTQHKIDLDAYLIMAYEIIIVSNVIMIMLK